MIRIKVTNSLGESLVLSPAEDKYAIKKVTGLSPQSGTISTQKMAKHGTEFVHSTTDERNIVIYLKVVGDVESNRDALYAAFPTSLDILLEFETPRKKAKIAGYVENCDVDFFEMIATGQISILCPDPFFKAETAEIQAGTEPATVKSSCPFESGYGVIVAFTEDADGFTLTNETTGETLTINHSFTAGDLLQIDTEERTVDINGENEYNSKSGSWALLKFGQNIITASAPATIIFTDRYTGI